MSATLKIVTLFLLLSAFAKSKPTAREYEPIVVWHGMGPNAHARAYLHQLLSEELPGVYVRLILIGENDYDDVLNSYFLNVNTQVQQVCEMIRSDAKLQNGFNAIGLSQGGQFMRALVQRCPEARVKTLITLGSQHEGVYGLPKCPASQLICDIARRGASKLAYRSFVQGKIVQAQYWKDPRNIDSYLKYNTFLPDINNEGPVKNQTYAKNLAALENFVMVRFNLDNMVTPIESSWFGFYAPGQAKDIQKFNETTSYQEDWLGLKTLDERGSLHFLELNERHCKIPKKWFKESIIDKYLNK